MSTPLRALIDQRIRETGPLTTAAFMELALYHPVHGYYARAPRRTGRAGDFYTSVDVGPQFGALLAVQVEEMWRRIGAPGSFDLVEVGAGNGQLGRDLLDAVHTRHPELYPALRLTLVEAGAAARGVHARMLGPHEARLAGSRPDVPGEITGVVLANELLDALPTHTVTLTPDGLCEIYVDLADGRLLERLGPPSTPALAAYLDRLGLDLAPGWRGEINLAAVRWIQDLARSLRRGFAVLIDYGHTADRLYGGHHATGTLTTFRRHVADGTGQDPAQPDGPPWLASPGDQDITAHVDLTSIQTAAADAGLDVLGLVDQTRFLLGLGALDLGADDAPDALRTRLALKTLLVPGGLGSSHQVLLLGRDVGGPRLRGLSMAPAAAARTAAS